MPHRLDNKRYLLWLALGTATMAVVMAVMLAEWRLQRTIAGKDAAKAN